MTDWVFVGVFSGHMTSPTVGNSHGVTSVSGRRETAYNDAILAAFPDTLHNVRFLKVVASDDVPLARRATHLSQVDLLIEVHHDSAQANDIDEFRAASDSRSAWRGAEGYSVFIADRTTLQVESLALAQTIGRHLRATGRRPNLYHARDIPGEGRELIDPHLGVYRGPFRVLRQAQVPAVLVECGVVVNPYEEPELATESVQRDIARALAAGVAEFIENR